MIHYINCLIENKIYVQSWLLKCKSLTSSKISSTTSVFEGSALVNMLPGINLKKTINYQI